MTRYICMLLLCPTLLACSSAHEPLRPCTPANEGIDCSSDEACRENVQGDFVCITTCDPLAPFPQCADGEVCLHRPPGSPWVCWPGGPVLQSQPCSDPAECARGLSCNRDGVCEEVCDYPRGPCSTPGLTCDSRGDPSQVLPPRPATSRRSSPRLAAFGQTGQTFEHLGRIPRPRRARMRCDAGCITAWPSLRSRRPSAHAEEPGSREASGPRSAAIAAASGARTAQLEASEIAEEEAIELGDISASSAAKSSSAETETKTDGQAARQASRPGQHVRHRFSRDGGDVERAASRVTTLRDRRRGRPKRPEGTDPPA